MAVIGMCQERLVLDRIRYGITKCISLLVLKLQSPKVAAERVGDQIKVEVGFFMAGKRLVQHTQTRRTPASWWQHFKAQYYPLWLKRRWPAQYTTETTPTVTVYLNFPGLADDCIQGDRDKYDVVLRTAQDWLRS